MKSYFGDHNVVEKDDEVARNAETCAGRSEYDVCVASSRRECLRVGSEATLRRIIIVDILFDLTSNAVGKGAGPGRYKSIVCN